MATDSAGNTYLTGSYRNTVHFGSTTLNASNLGDDIFVAKFDARGTMLWLRQAGGADNIDVGQGLGLDARGNVYITGFFISTTASFGSISLASPVVRNTQPPGYAAFVAKLDPNGNWLWAKSVGGRGPHLGADIAVDRAGTAYITGLFWDAASFGSTTLTNFNPNLSSDAFVARIDAQGNWGWAVAGGGRDADGGTAIGLDAQGNVYQTGYTAGQTARFGPQTFNSPSTFVSKLDAQGNYQWVVPSGNTSPGVQFYTRSPLAVDAAGSCRFGSRFTGTYSFGGITLTSASANSWGTSYVARLDANGRYRWVQPDTSPLGNQWTPADLTLDAAGNSYVCGSFAGTAQLGPTTLTSSGRIDGFVAQLDADGNWRWTLPMRGSDPDEATCVALPPGGSSPSVAGDYDSPLLDFGQGLTLPGGRKYTFLTRALPPPTLQLTGDTLLCQGGQVQLTAQTTGAVTGYLWSTGATTASISVSAPGTYSITATFRGGYTLTERIQVRSISPRVQITGATASCPGTPQALTAQAMGALSYLWNTGATTASINVTQPGTYSVTARFSSGCAVTATHILAANTVSISGRQQLCPGQSATLTATTSGSPATGYLWSTGATTATLLVDAMGTYSVTATFADGCRRTSTYTVRPPVATVAAVSGDTLLCPNTTLQLTALNPDALSYSWNTGATTATIPVTRPGRYAVTLTFAGGCSSRDSLLVQAAPLAPAFTLGNDTTLCLEQPLVLRAPALNLPGGVTYRWSDGSTGPTLTVTEPGTYSLQLTTHCDARTVTRRVAYQSCLFLPNVITPNGDGRNDRFIVNGLTKGPWTLEIYNRWGTQVFRAADYRHDWGPDAPAGTYFYRLSQGSVAYKGHLEVVR